MQCGRNKKYNLDQLKIWLIVASLIASTMYEEALTPPRGVYQIRVGDNNWNITSFNSTISPLESGKGEFDVQLPKEYHT